MGGSHDDQLLCFHHISRAGERQVEASQERGQTRLAAAKHVQGTQKRVEEGAKKGQRIGDEHHHDEPGEIVMGVFLLKLERFQVDPVFIER